MNKVNEILGQKPFDVHEEADTYEDFLAEFKELNFNYCAMGRKYGVSDNAIRKWEKSYKKYGF